jgi:hypothetical protein
MIRSFTSILAVVVGMGLMACEKAADQQQKADSAREDAQKKVDSATRDANDKINAAREEESRKVAEAQANFLKIREDYRHSISEDLTKLDARVAGLEAKAKTATGKAKAKLDTDLANIRSLRENVTSEYRSLEYSSALTWDKVKASVDKAYDDLKKAVDDAD